MPCLVVVAEADRSDLVYHGRVAPIAMIEIGALIRNRPVTGLSIYGLLQLSRIHRGRRKRLAAGKTPLRR